MVSRFHILFLALMTGPLTYGVECDPYGMAVRMESLTVQGVLLPDPRVLIKMSPKERASALTAYLKKFVKKNGTQIERYRDTFHVALTYLARASSKLNHSELVAVWEEIGHSIEACGGGYFIQHPFNLNNGGTVFTSPAGFMLIIRRDNRIFRALYSEVFPQKIPEDPIEQIEFYAQREYLVPKEWEPDLASPFLQEVK